MATHYVTWKVDGRECRYDGSEEDVREVRHFMLHTSPLQRDEISEVTPTRNRGEDQ